MVLRLWQVRENNVEGFDPIEIYANEPNLFTLKVFHGGEFVNCPGMKYVRGKVGYIDMVDFDEFSVHEFDVMIQMLGYPKEEAIYYYYKIPTMDLNIGLRPLGNDKDVLSLFEYVQNFKVISVYTEHGNTKLNTYFQSPDQSSKVIIEEIDDDVGPSIPRRNRLLQIGWQEQQELDLGQGSGFNEESDDEVNVVNENVQEAVQVNVANDDEVDLEQVNVANDDVVGVQVNVADDDEVVVQVNVANDEDPFIGLDEILGQSNIVNENVQEDDHGDAEDVQIQPNAVIDDMMAQDDMFLSNFIHHYVQEDDHGDSNADVDDSEDSDFIVDEENMVEDVEVDMNEFRAAVDDNIAEENEEADLDNIHKDTAELDLDDFESASECESDTPLAKALKKIKKSKRTWKADVTAPFYVGQTIVDKEDIKCTIKRTAVDTRRQLVIVKNDKLRIRVVCHGINPDFVCSEGQLGESSKSGGSSHNKASKVVGSNALNKTPKKRFPLPTCPWTLHISRTKIEDVWCVKTFIGEHRCLNTRDVRLYTVSSIAKEVEQIIEANPTIPLKALQDLLQRKHQVHISLQKIFRAKSMACMKLHGDYTAQYSLLRDYCEELIRSNPGSTVKIDVERECNPGGDTRQFKRIYICFAALRAGFKACGRDILGLDGCFIKGPYPGQVLTAVGVDCNNGIYPVAYAIVEAETTLSWTWFLECLGQDLDLSANSNFTFISDRQKGIIPALKKVFPAADHRYCLRHIHENMKSRWRGNMFKDLLWKCAITTTVPEFQRSMEAVRKQDASLHQWLKDIPPKHWSRSHFSERPTCDVLLNNICEVFNKQLVGGRDKPIITCLEYIREYLMRRIVVVHKLISKAKGPLTPSATKTFSIIKSKAADYNVIMAGFNKFQVNGPWMDQVAVDLERHTCSCRKWQLTGMPCKHAVACIWDLAKNNQQDAIAETWVSKVYWLETWKSVYQHTIEPINGRAMWMPSRCPTSLTPPKHHTQVGRPKKKRKKTSEELAEGISRNGKMVRKGASVTCGKCKNKGHNSRSCKGQGSSQAVSQGAPQQDTQN